MDQITATLNNNYNNTKKWILNKTKIDDKGIWVPCCQYTEEGTKSSYKLLMSKDDFVKAYKLYILGEFEQ